MTDQQAPGPSDAALAALATLVAVARRLDAAQRLERTADDPLLAAVTQTAAVVLEAQAASIAVHECNGSYSLLHSSMKIRTL